MKKAFCMFICVAFLFVTSFSFNTVVFAAQSENIEKTQLGTSTTYYEYNATSKTLTISGTGAVPDMKNNESSQPWYNWRSDASIANVVVDEGVTAIGNYCFFGVSAENFSIPSTLKTIGRYAFSSSGIKSADMPFGLTSIGNYAFDACTELESITLPDTLKTVGSNAFRLCVSLEEISIPYSVKSIGSYAFDRCSTLSSVTFDDMTSDVSLGSYAFYDCPLLTDVTFPSRATFAKQVYGFGRNGAASGVSMHVYDGSDAHIYAVANGVDFTLRDGAFPLMFGVQNTVVYTEDNLSDGYAFTFTPEFTADYNFYSRGDCDVKVQLYCGDVLLGESDDISSGDRNFCITAQLEQGTAYVFKVFSMHSEGTATVILYPDVINSFDVYGSLEFNAEDGFRSSSVAYFPVVNSAISDFVLDVHFEGGYSDKIYYSAGYFNNKQISIADTQNTETFTCGANTEKIAIGDVKGDFTVFVNHTYISEVVDYTLYEDGYTLYTCILCGDNYKTDFVPTPAVTVSGRCVLMTHPNGSYSNDYPLDNVTVTLGDETYTTDRNGEFSFRTFASGELTLQSPYCDSIKLNVLQKKDSNFGVIPLAAYDFNRDGYINGRDLAIFKTDFQSKLGKDYFRYAVNFM
ncbi:MAG: leucine-rich repeat domain-containing protein [Ruminococcaceae bacterium]|nr:leucine-rich repeat domain-containing protein [Oscillospiraceae bacterium]